MRLFFVVLAKPLGESSAVHITEENNTIGGKTFHENELTIFELKKLIWRELNGNEEGSNKANQWMLWKVEDLIEGGEKWKALEDIEDSNTETFVKNELNGNKLTSAMELKDVFSVDPPKGEIHILVQLSPPPATTGKRKAEDSNEGLDNKKVKQIELRTPESVVEFLAEQEGVKDDFSKPHVLCRNEFNFQRKGRDETLHKLYDCIVERYIGIKEALRNEKGISDKSFHPVLALQATPGGGKSFLLDELAAFKSKDFDNYLKSKERPTGQCPFSLKNDEYYAYIRVVKNVIDMLRNSIGICITYNGNPSYNYDRFVDDDVERGLVMRILWSYFFDDKKLSWQEFCERFSTNFKSLGIFTAIKGILYHSKKRVFLCIDETMKILSNTDTNRRQDKINEFLNNLYNPYQGLAKNKEDLIKFNFILTTLDAVYVQANTTASGRRINWIPLRRLEISESIELFHEILNGNELDKKRTYLIRKCISDCNGHPRTLEKFYQLLHEDGTALHIDMYSSLLSRLVNKIISWFSCITFSVIKAALLGNSISLKHKINTLNGEFSISDLISSGVYINSLTKEKDTINVVPTLTLISLQYFCTNNVEEGDAKIAVKILQDILLTEFYFDGKVMDRKPFESFHGNWELLYRVLREEGKEVSLREVYCLSDTIYTDNKLLKEM